MACKNLTNLLTKLETTRRVCCQYLIERPHYWLVVIRAMIMDHFDHCISWFFLVSVQQTNGNVYVTCCGYCLCICGLTWGHSIVEPSDLSLTTTSPGGFCLCWCMSWGILVHSSSLPVGKLTKLAVFTMPDFSYNKSWILIYSPKCSTMGPHHW